MKYVSGTTGTAAVTWDYPAWNTDTVTYNSSNEDEPIEIKGSDAGYGFADNGLSTTLDGRDETSKFTVDGIWPANVYGDYAAVMTAFEFMADVENGEYVVEIMVSGTSQSTTYYSVEGGSAFSLRNDTYNYKVQRVTGVTITDGQINITGQTGTHRLVMIVIRKVSSAGEDTAVNKTALQSLYNSVSGYSSSEYTNSSWTTFSTALKEAEEMLTSTTASQDEVDLMVTELKAAIEVYLIQAIGLMRKFCQQLKSINKYKYP